MARSQFMLLACSYYFKKALILISLFKKKGLKIFLWPSEATIANNCEVTVFSPKIDDNFSLFLKKKKKFG